MRAQKYVQQIKKINSIIRNKNAEKAMLAADACNISSPSLGERVQTSGNPHRMENAIINSMSARQEIDKRIKELEAQRAEIIETIELLPVAEYDLLHKVYVQYLTLAEAAFAVGKSYSWATTVHGTALKRLQAILDERGLNE